MDKRHTECILTEMMRWLGTNSPLKKSHLQKGNLDTRISSKIFWESWSLKLYICQRWYKQQPCTFIYSKPKEFEVQKMSSKVPEWNWDSPDSWEKCKVHKWWRFSCYIWFDFQSKQRLLRKSFSLFVQGLLLASQPSCHHGSKRVHS